MYRNPTKIKRTNPEKSKQNQPQTKPPTDSRVRLPIGGADGVVVLGAHVIASAAGLPLAVQLADLSLGARHVGARVWGRRGRALGINCSWFNNCGQLIVVGDTWDSIIGDCWRLDGCGWRNLRFSHCDWKKWRFNNCDWVSTFNDSIIAVEVGD